MALATGCGPGFGHRAVVVSPDAVGQTSTTSAEVPKPGLALDQSDPWGGPSATAGALKLDESDPWAESAPAPAAAAAPAPVAPASVLDLRQ
jgi:hypothetical protein